MLISLCLMSQAQSIFTSTNLGGDWTDPTSWSENNQGNINDSDGIPDTDDNVIITSGNPITIATATGQNVNDLTLTDGELTFTISGADLNVRGELLVNGTSTSLLTASADFATDPRIDMLGLLSVDASASLNIGGVLSRVVGATTINGRLAFISTVGTKIFSNITLESTGTWDNSTVTESFLIDGNIINNGGVWNGCSDAETCKYVMRATASSISGTGAINMTDIVVNSPDVCTNNGTLIVTDNIVGTGTIVNGASGALTLSENGSYTIATNGTLTLNEPGNIVIYGGTVADILLPGPFYNLQINVDDPATLIQMNGSDVAVDNDLTITSGKLRLQTANTLTVGGDVNIQTNGEFEPNATVSIASITGNINMTGGLYDQNGSSVSVGGDFLVSGGSLTLDNALSSLAITGNYEASGGNTDLNRGGIQFVDMNVTLGASVAIANPAITSTGTVTVDNGSLIVDGASGTYIFNNIVVNTSGVWDATSAYDPTINGNLTNHGMFTGCVTTTGCNYTLTSVSGIITGSAAMANMSDFVLNDGANYTNTNTSGVAITDRLATTSGTGTFVNGANGVMSYGGSTGGLTVSNFTASATGNTVTYNSTTANQALKTTTDNTYQSLIIDKADGIDVTTTAELTINGMLTLTAGDLVMGAQNLIIGTNASISGAGPTSFIEGSGAGVLRRNVASIGSYSIPIGGTNYSPITIELTEGTLGANASLDFSVTDAAHPNRNRDNTGDTTPGDDDGTVATDFLDIYWTVGGNDITAPVYHATYQYNASDFTQTTESNMVGVLYRTLPGTATLDWLARGIVSPGMNTVSFTDINAFGDLYAMDNTLNRLPIVLLSFDAKQVQNRVEVYWSTTSETNNSFFTIERSENGVGFEPVIFLNGAGNSESTIHYKVTDIHPLLGRSYYRLKQTDFNGNFAYSELISVLYERADLTSDFELYPNPSPMGGNLILTGNFSEVKNLTITGPDGVVIYSKDLSSYTGSQFQLVLPSSMLPGIYFVSLIQSDQRFSRKLIVR